MVAPSGDYLPTGEEIVTEYLEPLSRVPAIASELWPGAEVTGITRLGLDPAVEAPPALAPLIDPNFHSCGTVPPHGIDELTHPEPGLTIVGSKSYGRAPTFLMATGYEQVRSMIAEIAGDSIAARKVRLVLPETGVCGAPASIGATSSCCGGPAPAATDTCCADDAATKKRGEVGCGCGSPTVEPIVAKTACCQSAA